MRIQALGPGPAAVLDHRQRLQCQPRQQPGREFREGARNCAQGLETLTASIDQNHTENIEGLRKDLMCLRGNFNELMQEQKTLGFDESSGLRRNLQVAGNAVERIIN
ncbi:MAG TPA: hypothetical protein VM822_08100 [Pseudolabrys sp.]|nr:hypothetical protein [Pseudolabrys sp.]